MTLRRPKRSSCARCADDLNDTGRFEQVRTPILVATHIAEYAGARETVDVLNGVCSVVDVTVYVWQEDESRWRLLTLDEQRALWDLSRRA